MQFFAAMNLGLCWLATLAFYTVYLFNDLFIDISRYYTFYLFTLMLTSFNILILLFANAMMLNRCIVDGNVFLVLDSLLYSYAVDIQYWLYNVCPASNNIKVPLFYLSDTMVWCF